MGFPWFTWGGGCARLPDVPMGGAGGVLTAASHRSLCDGNKKIPGHLPDHTGWSGEESVPPYQLFCFLRRGKRGVGVKVEGQGKGRGDVCSKPTVYTFYFFQIDVKDMHTQSRVKRGSVSLTPFVFYSNQDVSD